MKTNDLKKHEESAFKFNNIYDFRVFAKECDRLGIKWIDGDDVSDERWYKKNKHYFLKKDYIDGKFRVSWGGSNRSIPVYSGFCKIENIE